MSSDYLDINRKAWNAKAEVHYNSEFYRTSSFLEGENHLKKIELDLLGDIRGLKILHLQCHFGLDTLSMARMGANVCGVDLSDVAISQARELSERSGVPGDFICSDVYRLPEVHEDKYDIVFSTYGTIGWLPDMKKWVEVVSHFLKPGGKLLLVEFHPFVWTFDYQMKSIAYDYFNGEEIREIEQGSYTDSSEELETLTVSWNHDLGEVLGEVLSAGLEITHFGEYDFSPYACFENLREDGPSVYRFKHINHRIPMVYSLMASKNKVL